MRRLYVEPREFDERRLALTDERARRLRSVLRLQEGAALHVFDGFGREREATVALMAAGVVTLDLGAAVEPLPEPAVAVTLLCAFPRGSRGDWIVEKTTELGVARVVPLAAERAVLDPGEGRIERWRRVAIEAAEQCGRAVVPAIGGSAPEAAVSLVAAAGGVSVREALLRSGADLAAPRDVAFYVGPEGGWSERERAEHAGAGRIAVSLGPRTLRVETAAIVGVAQAIEATGGLAGASATTG